MTNLNSVTELTEFAPLSPEIKQASVASIFSKFFKFSQDGSSEVRGKNNSKSNSPIFYSPVEEDNSFNPGWTIVDKDEGNSTSMSPSLSTSANYLFSNNLVEARNLPNVLRRVSGLLALRHKNSLAYKDTNLKQYWMPDSVSKECYDCGEKFTTFRRKHHCRVCGQIFCSQCCNQEVPGKIVGCSGNLRVCTYCCKVVLSYLQSADIEADLSADLKALQDDLLSKFGNNSFISYVDEHSSDTSDITSSNTSESKQRKMSVVYQEEKFVTGRTANKLGWNENVNTHKSETATLNTLLHELINGENALSLQNFIVQGCKYESCFMGSTLIDWLISQRKTTSRTHSFAICQVLLDANYIENVTESSVDFVDGATLYKFSTVPHTVSEKNENNKDCISVSSETTSQFFQNNFHLDLNIHKSTVHVSRNPQKISSVKDKKKTIVRICDDFTDEMVNDFIRRYSKICSLIPVCWATVDEENLNKKNNEISSFRSLSDAFHQHLLNAVNQLLALENLSLSWAQIIVPLAEQALNEIKLDFSKTNTINIGDYVQIKKLSAGERKDSCLVRGIVCSKNVAHKEMCTHLANPRILLLQCAVVYQRVQGRLMSLEPVMMQEQEYLRHSVARIVALRPDVVLVHRNVSRLAQESLNSLGITLVLNVKMSVIERVALCTNSDILTSVDAHVGSTKLGTCRSFYTKEFAIKNGCSKTLMFFEGCAFPQFGCTLLLRGASDLELKKLKNVTNSVVFMNYNAKLEKSFLMDEFVMPPIVPSFTFVEEMKSPKRGSLSPADSFELCCDGGKKSCDGKANNSNSDIKESECKSRISEMAKIEISRKVVSEEKRSSAKLIVDEDDPLHVNACTETDDVFRSETESNVFYDLSFTEVPMKQNKFRTALQDTFNVPYLETKTGRSCELRRYFQKDIYYSAYLNYGNDLNRNVTVSDPSQSLKAIEPYNMKKKTIHSFVYTQLKDNVANEEVQSLLAFYRACGGRFLITDKYETCSVVRKPSNVNTKPENIDFLDPRNHQRLSVLFCSFSHYSNNAPEFCVNPWIVNMDFYGCNDIPLGSFLEKYCFRTSYMCPSETCETSMIDHERRFVHDTGCVHVTLREIDALSETVNEPILIWSRCTVCKAVTPVTPMSGNTWNLSFAKYLELRFHAGKYTCRAEETCEHSLHHDYCQYFYHKNIVASFKYVDILLWELSLPALVIKIHPSQFQVPIVMEQVKKWAVMGHEVFSSILEKLCLLDFDDVTTVQGLKKHLIKQQTIFKQKVDDIQVLITSASLTGKDEDIESVRKALCKFEDCMVIMKRSVAETLFNWNPLLTKLDAWKREDKQKTKSFTSDIIDNIPGDFNTKNDAVNYTEEIYTRKETKEELSNPEEIGGNQDFMISENENLDEKFLDRSYRAISVDSSGDGNANQVIYAPSSSTETISTTASQTQISDKITVKALLSQLLPNTFQNTASMLSNPINSEEHYLLNVSCSIPIVVYESEPSSIIAYALSTYHYQYSLEDIVKNTPNVVDQNTKYLITKKESSEGTSTIAGVDAGQQLPDSDDLMKIEIAEDSKPKSMKVSDDHIEVNFADSTANFTVKVYFAHQFKELRNTVFPAGEDVYVRSLSRCVRWAAHGGKSGSSFCKTKDDRFILKEMPRPEIQPFLEFAPNYFNFIRNCYVLHQPTLLVKIVGVYRVKYRNVATNQTFQSNLLVMENLFYMRDIIRKFDLKGSVRNRLVNTKTTHERELVLLDENLINMTCESPLYIYPHSKTVLMQAINIDVTFLASQSVMDYSLLVGLDETSQELVVGIIDYIRTFTWDKKIETIVKKSGILGGQGKLPTIVSPEEYKNRFIAAMHKYFLAVPDQWLGFGKGIDY